MASFAHRIMGAAMLDLPTYEEVERDRGGTGQALGVVVLSSIAAAVGLQGLSQGAVLPIAVLSIMAVMAWASWALVTFEVGARLIPEPQTRADLGQLLRTLGFATAPGLLQVFGVLPGVTVPVFVLAIGWTAVTMVVAVRQALDYRSTGRAVLVCGIGLTLALVIVVVLGLLVGPAVS